MYQTSKRFYHNAKTIGRWVADMTATNDTTIIILLLIILISFNY